ncbi:MAG TPA: pyridoxamine 5'-phosphate oxidase family protein [Steroidobacteraceae bacterium]|nr:pyridoxamine 5'-phosphate oxidase family protein [Steroidobacteraceae bacterium]
MHGNRGCHRPGGHAEHLAVGHLTSTIAPTPRTTLVRHPERASYDRATVNAILDEGLVCHVGFVVDGQPFVLATTHARIDEQLYLHGAPTNHMLGSLEHGAPVCVTVTLIDALVLARAAFRHSMNYRSVVVLGAAREVTAEDEKRLAMHALIERVHPGRTALVRAPSPEELKSTTLLRLSVTEASAKVRTGPPIDLEADYASSCWAGVLPLELIARAPIPDPRLAPGTPVPASVSGWSRKPPGSGG